MAIDLEKSWDFISRHYQAAHRISTEDAHYGPSVPGERQLRLLGNVRGKKILEIGCGGGQCSIAFAKRGAIATGIDFSKEQIKYARELAGENKVGVNFIQGNLEKRFPIASGSQDIVFSSYALQYVGLEKCFREVHRVLKNKGLFVFSLEHPFFGIFRFGSKKLEVVQSYFDTGIAPFRWGYPKKSPKFYAYVRTLSGIYNALVDAGFFAEKIIEPKPLKKDLLADYSKYYPYEKIKMAPSTIIFKARKTAGKP